ncbi:hypothetical protein tb265_18190 [Gemmatimonadetes bacterium T265]|nr:hypothetical protein tb265_18190 [Gemmatimonadetes bacterium T265]
MTAVPPLAAVAHELRTPLGGILGCADLLAATALDAEQRAHLDALREAAAALAAFADDALELARLGDPAAHAAVRVGRCDVRATVAGVVRTLAPRAARRGLALDVAVADDVPCHVCADAGALRRVLVNLGANAVRATRRGGVRFTAAVHGGALVCAVTDTGVGMTPAQRDRLFRAWATGGAEDGVGLGLVLVAELAARMRGEIAVESAPGSGSTFALRLPV